MPCLRSEINSCHRRDRDDPQITINLGTVLSFPDSQLVPCDIFTELNCTRKMPQWNSLPPDLTDSEPPVPGVMAGGRHLVPGDGRLSVGVLGAGGVQEH